RPTRAKGSGCSWTGLLPLAAAALTRAGADWLCPRGAAIMAMATSRPKARTWVIRGTFIRSPFLVLRHAKPDAGHSGRGRLHLLVPTVGVTTQSQASEGASNSVTSSDVACSV